MADATVTRRVTIADPNTEVVVLEVSHDEDYKCEKFGTILAASAAFNFTGGGLTDESISCSFSGQTVTIDIVGTDSTDVPVTLTIHGEQ